MELSVMNNIPPVKEAPDSPLQQNAKVLINELGWLSQVIDARVALHFSHDTPYKAIEDLPAPDPTAGGGPYAGFIHKYKLNAAERLALILGLAPHLKPGILDILSSKNQEYDRRFSEFGGLFIEGHSGLLPTAETVLFILAGDDVAKRMHYQYLFRPDHVLTRTQVIFRNARKKGAPRLSGVWMVAHEYVDYLISGQPYEAEYSEDFPAQRIGTQLEWEDIVLARVTAKSLQEIRNWVEYGHVVMHDLGLSKRLKPGYKSLFYGPPGTGKTETAALLGKSTSKPVYKVDLSMVVSKYIGETEKNLANLFDKAQNKNWILFFDEADALLASVRR
ncbi:MAG: ATP-binding protein [Sinomicrobium sp.]|nr:ATP-binding protein [Sinomicrobium sp.]